MKKEIKNKDSVLSLDATFSERIVLKVALLQQLLKTAENGGNFPLNPHELQTLTELGLTQADINRAQDTLLDKFIEVEHSLGWCTDPECVYDVNKTVNSSKIIS